MWKTPISELLGIEYPIIQGGMAWCSNYPLAAAVSNGGGLGVIGSGAAPAEWVAEQIKETRKNTDKPFGVNIMLMNPCAEDIAKLVADEGVSCVITGAGSPGKYIPMWKEAGVKVLPVIPSVALAKRVVRQGADAVICEGCEAGGHIGELTTMAMTPQVVDAVDVPVVAAGGIGDGRGMAAAFMLGAQGVQMGTRFLCAAECTIHQNYKDKLIKAEDTSTVVTGRSIGIPARMLKNFRSREMLEEEDKNISKEEFEKLGSGLLRAAAVDGDVDWGSPMAGQIAGLVNGVEPAAQIIKEVAGSAMRLLKLV